MHSFVSHLSLCLLLLWFGLGSAASWSPIHNVVVVGGTHGNEYTGVWCIKAIDKAGPPGGPYPSLHISTLLGNPQAYLENKRFIDADLNREFSHEKLVDIDDSLLIGSEGLPLTVESLRARELNLLLGPKFGDTATDLIVDLHSTTSNMGLTIIVPEGDVLMAQAAAHVLAECGVEETRILMHTIPDRAHRPNLSSTGRHGFTIEVGPVPQGVLRHDAVEKTQQALAALFGFLQQLNEEEVSGDASKSNALKRLRERYPTGRVPCYMSAKKVHKQQMSGKILWPVDEDNPNFPALMVHKSLQDRDFHQIRKGDTLFVDLEGKEIPYDGSHGDQVHLIFVNEGGYYYQSSGTGVGVAVATEYNLEDGMLHKDGSARDEF